MHTRLQSWNTNAALHVSQCSKCRNHFTVSWIANEIPALQHEEFQGPDHILPFPSAADGMKLRHLAGTVAFLPCFSHASSLDPHSHARCELTHWGEDQSE